MRGRCPALLLALAVPLLAGCAVPETVPEPDVGPPARDGPSTTWTPWSPGRVPAGDGGSFTVRPKPTPDDPSTSTTSGPASSTSSPSATSSSTSATQSSTSTSPGPSAPGDQAPATQPVVLGQGPTVGINVVQAIDRSCAGDVFTDDDFRATVWVNGSLVGRTPSAQDRDDPLFAHLFVVTLPSHRVTLQFRLEEMEPLDARELCDISTATHGDAVLEWDGSQQALAFIGDGSHAAELRVTLGPAHPPAPTLTLAAIGPTTAVFASEEGNVLHHGDRALGPFEGGQRAIQGLCDDTAYTLRSVLAEGAWRIGTALAIRTPNAAPAPPRVHAADANASALDLRWDEPTPHDIDHYDIYVGPDADVPTDEAHRVATRDGFGSSIRQQSHAVAGEHEGHVRIVATDKGGLSTAGPSFAIGAPHAERGPAFEECHDLR